MLPPNDESSKSITDFFKEVNLSPKELSILLYPNHMLMECTQPVEQFDDQLNQLIVDMFYTVQKRGGIGLAGPQVGVSKRIVVLLLNSPLVMINPIIVAYSGAQTHKEECLSIPGSPVMVTRYEKIRVIYQDNEGNHVDAEVTGIAAQCIQHELDHLDGKLIENTVDLIPI